MEKVNTDKMLYGNWQFSSRGTLFLCWYRINLLSKHFSLPCKRKLWKYSISSQSQQPLLILTFNKEATPFKVKNGSVPASSAFPHPTQKYVALFFSSLKGISPKPMPSCRKVLACENQVISMRSWAWASVEPNIRLFLLKCWSQLWTRSDNKKKQPGWAVGLEA